MINGRINASLEAKIELSLMMGEREEPIEFLVETGFNGFLAIPMELVLRPD